MCAISLSTLWLLPSPLNIFVSLAVAHFGIEEFVQFFLGRLVQPMHPLFKVKSVIVL